MNQPLPSGNSIPMVPMSPQSGISPSQQYYSMQCSVQYFQQQAMPMMMPNPQSMPQSMPMMMSAPMQYPQSMAQPMPTVQPVVQPQPFIPATDNKIGKILI